MSTVLQTIQEKAQQLSPEQQEEVISYIDNLLADKQPQLVHELTFAWADGPDDEPVALTSVEMQHMATLWRIEEELDLNK